MLSTCNTSGTWPQVASVLCLTEDKALFDGKVMEGGEYEPEADRGSINGRKTQEKATTTLGNSSIGSVMCGGERG